MAIRDVLVYPDPRLKQISSPVTKFDSALQDFIRDLNDTMLAGPGCVGIAAPQVGHFERIVIVDLTSKPKNPNHGKLVLINPVIVESSGEKIGREGCLSVPDYTGNIVRAKNITLSAYDEEGNPQSYEMKGFEARVAQHEIDHLDGRLFLDRLVCRRSELFPRQNYAE
ncbi:MAG: peptide deformylase [Nitrospinae bacterium CG11_big_fil_rev_8_21_14_0_20_45_15]|nr:MAG: peptide deformylase [Nitrospinae bacterium CG11_big_fil_rev_8_21_14_0_20_45_15]